MTVEEKIYFSMIGVFILMLVGLSLAGCNKVEPKDPIIVEPPPPPGEKIKYSYLEAAIFAPKCATCHGGIHTFGNFSVASHADVVKAVFPGNPDASTLCKVLRNHRMPPSKPLDPERIDEVCKWIQEGAQPSFSFLHLLYW